MGEYSIDIRHRFQSAHGFVAQNAVANTTDQIGLGGKLFYQAEKMQGQEPNQQWSINVEFITPREAIAKTAMGTPVFDQMTLTDEETGAEYSFSFPPMVDRSRSKKIVETPVVDGENEVVEIIGKNAWDITIRGIVVDMDNHHDPGDQVAELYNFFDIDRPLKVSSLLLNKLNISRLYFRRIDLAASEYPDTQGFILEAKSYVPVEIIIVDNNA